MPAHCDPTVALAGAFAEWGTAMNTNFDRFEDARAAGQKENKGRISAGYPDRAKVATSANRRAIEKSSQKSRRRTARRRGDTGPSELEWEFLTKWGLLKSPLRWN